jgi:imidazolonepropionase-like amidohydrolase
MIAFLLAQTIAITGGTVYPVSGPKIENATVLIRDGKIAAVGTNVAVPAGATRIDASGKWVTPGFIDGAGQMGLREIGAVQGTNEYTRHGNDVAAGFNVLEGINPASTLIAVNRMEGVTTTLAVPGYLGVPPSDGLIWGQAVLIDLDGATIEAMQIKSPAAMVANLSESSKDAGGGSRAAVAQRLRRVLNDAREYATRRADYRRRQIQDLGASAADLESLQPVLRGALPLIVLANRRSDIETALRIAREYKLQLILAGAAEGWMIPNEIAAAGVPVLIEPMDNIPSFDALGIRYENAPLLAKGGVKVALMETTTENTRDLRQQAGNAVASGMTWEQALRAVTLTPAEILGVAGQYGSLDAGKVANVVVWTGDPFDFATGVEHVFIRGRDIPLRSRQTELLERYRTLPPKY